jgi:hypothetical protein
MSNEQLECDAVTGKTGKLEAEKNGWRNRMNQPVEREGYLAVTRSGSVRPPGLRIRRAGA